MISLLLKNQSKGLTWVFLLFDIIHEAFLGIIVVIIIIIATINIRLLIWFLSYIMLNYNCDNWNIAKAWNLHCAFSLIFAETRTFKIWKNKIYHSNLFIVQPRDRNILLWYISLIFDIYSYAYNVPYIHKNFAKSVIRSRKSLKVIHFTKISSQ